MVVQNLWAGADVRWVGPDETRDGVQVRHGDRAVVVYAGRHHVTSFSTVFHRAGQPRPAPGRGVRIRLADGPEIIVPRKHLEIVAPEHPLSPEPDPSHAAWWLDQLDEWGRAGVPVSSFVPSSLEVVCHVLHPWWGGPGLVRWRELRDRPEFAEAEARLQTSRGIVPSVASEAGLAARDGELDRFTAVALVDCLASATTTPDDVFVAVWEGRGDVPPQRFPGAARLDTQSRGHFLLRGPLSGILTSVAASRSDRPAAGIWWPADRSWFAVTEIDFPWTYAAGDDELINQLTGDERLEAVRTDFGAPANQPLEPR